MPSLDWSSKSSHIPIQSSLELDSVIYPNGQGYDTAHRTGFPPDQLILGDNLAVMSALLQEYEGRIDLIYVDPPFFTNRRYKARIGREEDSRKPEQWKLAEGYPDHWSDIEAYLDMLYPRLNLMYRLLSPSGTLYLHLDWHANSYARLLMDEIFGADRLLNEIIWVYHGPSPIRSAFNRKHDSILSYTKSKEYTFNVDDVRQPYDPKTIKTFASSSKAGFGKVPNLERGKVPEDWWYFPVVARLHNERTGYPTQKPEALMERIILASSNEGDIVADFFCGSGTTPAVAARLGRTYIATDASWRAVHTTRARLIRYNSPPFRMLHEGRTPYPLSHFPTNARPYPFQLSKESIKLSNQAIDSLDYWEVDPAWNEKIFLSSAQALLPLKKGSIPLELDLPVRSDQKTICARSVNLQGEQTQFLLASD
jgi:DNA modification methylase